MEQTPTTPETGGLIQCPVCDWPPTRENSCPNCHADLAPLRRVVTLPQRLLQMGLEMSRNGSPGALEHLGAALALNPPDVAAHLALGQAYLERGDPVLALAQAEQALERDSQHPEALALRERCLEARENRRRLQEKAGQTQAAPWRLYSLLATGVALVLAGVLMFAGPSRRLPPPAPGPAPVTRTTPVTRATPAQVAARLVPAFPSVSVAEVEGELQLAGEVPTYKDLVELRELLGDLPGIKFAGLKVKNEYFFRYVVKRGDSLSSLARRFYGQPARWTAILETNRAILKNPNVIQPGTLLIIPGERGTPP